MKGDIIKEKQRVCFIIKETYVNNNENMNYILPIGAAAVVWLWILILVVF
jgi:hypothetical protein